jgi:hypothetical protein
MPLSKFEIRSNSNPGIATLVIKGPHSLRRGLLGQGRVLVGLFPSSLTRLRLTHLSVRCTTNTTVRWPTVRTVPWDRVKGPFASGTQAIAACIGETPWGGQGSWAHARKASPRWRLKQEVGYLSTKERLHERLISPVRNFHRFFSTVANSVARAAEAPLHSAWRLALRLHARSRARYLASPIRGNLSSIPERPSDGFSYSEYPKSRWYRESS